jgi:hypothetical protein
MSTNKIFGYFIVIDGLYSIMYHDLNQAPNSTNAISGDEFFTDAASYKQNLAKLYAGFATSGQSGPQVC